MNKYELFEKFNITENYINVAEFVINAVIIIILSYILEWTYSKCAKSISNKKMFAANFILIAFTTMLIISIVKSHLALSLGLVGALSIVRFRSAIKEPEELAYLFLTISIGLGLGAGQRDITIIAFMIMIAIIWLRYLVNKKATNQNLFLTINSKSPIDLKDILQIVNGVFGKSEVNRYNKTGESTEIALLVDSLDPVKLKDCTEQIEQKYKDINISFIDHKNY